MVVFKRALAAFVIIFFSVTVSYADIVDRVVAVVNDDVITLSEVNQEGKVLLQRVTENVSPAKRQEALKQVRQKIINKLIENKIMLQEAEKANISVSDDEVERAYERILEQNNLTQDRFTKELAATGMTDSQYREHLRTQVLSSKLVNMEIRSKVIIPEDKIIDYYDTHYTERVVEGGFYLLQIGITWDEKNSRKPKIAATKEAALQKAKQIRELAIKGEDFRLLAREHSSLPSSIDGGDIGVLQDDDMSSDMFQLISGTKVGDISPIGETSSGYQFFKVLSSQDGQIITKVTYESVKDEIYERLYQQEIESRFEKWLKEMKSQAYIKIL